SPRWITIQVLPQIKHSSAMSALPISREGGEVESCMGAVRLSKVRGMSIARGAIIHRAPDHARPSGSRPAPRTTAPVPSSRVQRLRLALDPARVGGDLGLLD